MTYEQVKKRLSEIASKHLGTIADTANVAAIMTMRDLAVHFFVNDITDEDAKFVRDQFLQLMEKGYLGETIRDA